MTGDQSASSQSDQPGRPPVEAALADVRPRVPLRDMEPLRRAEAVARWGLQQASSRSGRRAMLRHAAFAAARSLTPVIAVDATAGEKYLVSTRDRAIGAITFSEGGLDLDVMHHALHLAETATHRTLRGRTFVDIGANIGTATIPALARFGAADAVAIEPEAENVKLLRCNVILNDVEDRVVTVNAALSDTTGTGLLELGGSNWGDHRIRASSTSDTPRYDETTREVGEVQIVTFDSLVADGTIDVGAVGVVWIDTQGHEAHVLTGAESLLASDVPVVLEYWPYGLRRAAGIERLHSLIGRHYSTVVDLRASAERSRPVELPASAVDRLEQVYTGTSYTDLLLLS